MSWYSGSSACCSIIPNTMRTSFTHKNTSVFTNMFYEINLFHKNQAKTAKFSRVTKERPSDFLDKRRLVSRISNNASLKLIFVSANVLP